MDGNSQQNRAGPLHGVFDEGAIGATVAPAKVGIPMGDKSPKNARKNVKQKSDAKLEKADRKQREQAPTLPPSA